MAKLIIMTCPGYVEAKDDVCGGKIEIDTWQGEPMTHWYPGSLPGFEVVDAPCGHTQEIDELHYDTIMQELNERTLNAVEAAIDAAIERAWERKHGL